MEDEEVGPDAATASARCTESGLAVCIDFEDMPLITDALGSAIAAVNVSPMVRLQEGAAQLAASSQLKIADSARLDIPMNLTIEMWTRPMQAPPDSGDKQVGLFDAHLQYQMNLETDRRIECRLYGGEDSLDSDVQLALGEWHHVACTHDGSELRVYVDGRLAGCRPFSYQRAITVIGTGAAVGANMDFGSQYKNPFVGELDNVHVYARTLSAAEICTLWGNGNCADTCPAGGYGGGGYGGSGYDND